MIVTVTVNHLLGFHFVTWVLKFKDFIGLYFKEVTELFIIAII